MGEECEERQGGAGSGRWEPQEACSAPGESSEYSDGPANGRGHGAARGLGDAGLARRRRRRPVWSRLEEAILAKQHSIRGNAWSAIAEHLPGRTASEVKNIWHSTLRSKKLKSRSLLRAYAREVQDHCDSAAARLEAFRSAVKLTRGTDDTLPDDENPQAGANGRSRPGSASSEDRDGDEPEPESGSPRPPPQVADSADAIHIAKQAYPPRSPTGSSDGEGPDTACLTSENRASPGAAPPGAPADRLNNRASTQARRSQAQKHTAAAQRHSREDHSHRRDGGAADTAAEAAAAPPPPRAAPSLRPSAEGLPLGEHPPLGEICGGVGGRRRRDWGEDSRQQQQHQHQRAGGPSTGRARGQGSSGRLAAPQPTGPLGHDLGHEAALQQLLLQQQMLLQQHPQFHPHQQQQLPQQQQQLGSWTVTPVNDLSALLWGASPRVKQERVAAQQQQHGETSAGRRQGAVVPGVADAADAGRGAADNSSRPGAGLGGRSREGAARASVDGAAGGGGGDSLNPLQVRLWQALSARGPHGYPKEQEDEEAEQEAAAAAAAAGSVKMLGWLQAQRWLPLQARAMALAHVQAQAQAQAEADALEEQAYCLTLLRDSLARQVQQQQREQGMKQERHGRQSAGYGHGGSAAGAAAATATAAEEADADGADGAWTASGDKVAFGGGDGEGDGDDHEPRFAQHRGAARRSGAPKASRRAPGTAHAAADGSAAAAAAAAATAGGGMGAGGGYYFGDRAQLLELSGVPNGALSPYAAAMAAAAAAAAGGGVPGYDPYGLLSLPQHLPPAALGLGQLGPLGAAMLGAPGDMDVARLMAAHSAAAAMAAADANAVAAQRLAWRRQAMASAWQAAEHLEGPSSTDTLTTVELRGQEGAAATLKHGKPAARRAARGHGAGGGGAAAGAAVPSDEVHAGTKRRMEDDLYDGEDPRTAAIAMGRTAAAQAMDPEGLHLHPAVAQAAAARLHDMYDMRCRLAGLYGVYGNTFPGMELPEDGAAVAAAAAAEWGNADMPPAAAAAMWGLPPLGLRGYGSLRDRLSAPGTGFAAAQAAGMQGLRRRPAQPRQERQQQQQPADWEDLPYSHQPPQKRQKDNAAADVAPARPLPQQPKGGQLDTGRQIPDQPPKQRRRQQGKAEPEQQQQVESPPQQQQQQTQRRERRDRGRDEDEAAVAADPMLCDFDVATALLSFSRQQPRKTEVAAADGDGADAAPVDEPGYADADAGRCPVSMPE